MSRPVIVVGGGGHAKVLIDMLCLRSFKILGVTEGDEKVHGQDVRGIPVIGSDYEIFKHTPRSILLVNGLGSTNVPKARQRLFENFKAKGYSFAKLIHPAAVVASDVIIGEGAQVMAGAVIQTGTKIGANSIINTNASVDHDCAVGDHAHLAPGVTLSGGVRVGDGVHVGSGSTVIQGVKIGEGTLIGAGSLVIRDVSSRVKAFGVPAKVVK